MRWGGKGIIIRGLLQRQLDLRALVTVAMRHGCQAGEFIPSSAPSAATAVIHMPLIITESVGYAMNLSVDMSLCG